jgi:hypothetical protein
MLRPLQWQRTIRSFQLKLLRRVWRYQRVNQNPYIEEEQTTQWPKENKQNAKQRSTKHTYKTKDRVTRTSLKTQVLRNTCIFISKSMTICTTFCFNIGWNKISYNIYNLLLVIIHSNNIELSQTVICLRFSPFTCGFKN